MNHFTIPVQFGTCFLKRSRDEAKFKLKRKEKVLLQFLLN